MSSHYPNPQVPTAPKPANSKLIPVSKGLIVLGLIALTLAAIYDRTLTRMVDRQLVYSLFQTISIIVMGSLALLAYRAFTIERDLNVAQRTDLESIYDQLVSTYIELIENIHTLRASVGFDHQSNRHEEALVDPSVYESSMKKLLHCKLVFGTLSNRLRDHHLGYLESPQIADHLQRIDAALAPLIEEFDAELLNVRNARIQTRIQDLPELLDIVRMSSPEHPFSLASQQLFNAATLGLSRARHVWNG